MGSNRRGHPFKGWVRSALSHSLQRQEVASLSRRALIYWDKNERDFGRSKLPPPSCPVLVLLQRDERIPFSIVGEDRTINHENGGLRRAATRFLHFGAGS